MEINIFNDPNKVPKPKDEIKIEELKAEPYPDGFRVRVTVRLTPFRERPNMFLALKQADGTLVNDLSIIETMHYDSDYVIHIKQKSNPAGDYVLEAELFYETRQPPQDHASIAFSIPNIEEN
jgi:hypothetical protein